MRMTPYQQFIYKSRYARFKESTKSRENWREICARYIDYIKDYTANHGNCRRLGDEVWNHAYDYLHNLEVFPSGRALMTAGEASKRENICIYNCSYMKVDRFYCFVEALYILMNGTGVGFSVEKEYVDKLFEAPDNLVQSSSIKIVVEDNKEGWADAFSELIGYLLDGIIPSVDFTNIRPAGSRLKTFGGRASGPEPLMKLFNFTTDLFLSVSSRENKKFTPLDCHELMCMIGEVVVVGGVRRSALISLSDLSNTELRDVKSGEWYKKKPYLGLSNNSVAYREKPSKEDFEIEWKHLVESHSGERGIFARFGVQEKIKELGERDPLYDYGTNPCGEIILKSNQFCNLTEVAIRPHDDLKSVEKKVVVATLFGTIQAMHTRFNVLSDEWKKNCEEEALLGVSLTGIFSNKFFSTPSKELAKALERLKGICSVYNHHYARIFGCNPSKAITTIKPSGTISQLANTTSGIHPEHSKYYLRLVRMDAKDPLVDFLKDAGFVQSVVEKITYHDGSWEYGKEHFINVESDTEHFISEMKVYDKNIKEIELVEDASGMGQVIFAFPKKSFLDRTKENVPAIELAKLVKFYNIHWSDHAVSCTINVKENEWDELKDWVYDNFKYLAGMTFLPDSHSIYKQLPFTKCDKETYEHVLKLQPNNIRWDKLKAYERGEDNTKTDLDFACVGGACEL